ncbi:MAG: aminotransferase class I and II [Anaerolineales bacterium]|nr:aminotransferase class I and II [Anaerolineales bacterium]
MVRTVMAARYVVPLREGGSLPAVVQADDGEMYVMKFIGAGQGRKALIAELLAGEIGRQLGLNVPELVLMTMTTSLGRSEPNPEIQALLRASTGLNLGMKYLPGAFAYNSLRRPAPDPELASAIVWFDALITNVDRTDRNVNMLIWEDALWLIDHGASLYVHHDWTDYQERSRSAFPYSRQHTLLRYASRLAAAEKRLAPLLDAAVIRAMVDEIPEQWLEGEATFADVTAHRAAYFDYLQGRVAASPAFTEEAVRARTHFV